MYCTSLPTLELEISRLGLNGEGVAYAPDGCVIFIEGALPGERVKAELYERKKSYGRAEVKETILSSPHRREPPCPYFGVCGGCQMMHLAYEEQLIAKRQRVIDALERIGGIKKPEVLPCLPSPQPLGYRNKIQLPVSSQGKLGLYARNSHDLVEIEGCLIHSGLGEQVLKSVQPLITPHAAYLRHLLIKTALHTGQALLILVTRDETFPKELAEKLLNAHPAIRGIVQNINSLPGNVILSSRFKTLAGQGWIHEKLHDLTFKVSPASFFQVNPLQAEIMYAKVAEFCALTKDEVLLDAYCGVGTLSLLLARQAKEVIGIESVSEAVVDAEENGKKNGISNVQFICGQAEKEVQRLDKVDVVVLNPPRKGCAGSLIDHLACRGPKRIVYVSCDPATLARDLKMLIASGYVLECVQPFDMFPQTAHVESAAKLVKAK